MQKKRNNQLHHLINIYQNFRCKLSRCLCYINTALSCSLSLFHSSRGYNAKSILGPVICNKETIIAEWMDDDKCEVKSNEIYAILHKNKNKTNSFVHVIINSDST